MIKIFFKITEKQVHLLTSRLSDMTYFDFLKIYWLNGLYTCLNEKLQIKIENVIAVV